MTLLTKVTDRLHFGHWSQVSIRFSLIVQLTSPMLVIVSLLLAIFASSIEATKVDCPEATAQWNEYSQTYHELQQFITDKYLADRSRVFRTKGNQRLSRLKEDNIQLKAFAAQLTKSQQDDASKCQEWAAKASETANRYKKLLLMEKLRYRFEVFGKDHKLWSRLDPTPKGAQVRNAVEQVISNRNHGQILITKLAADAFNNEVQWFEFFMKATTFESSLRKLESSIDALKSELINIPKAVPETAPERPKLKNTKFASGLETIPEKSEDQQLVPVESKTWLIDFDCFEARVYWTEYSQILHELEQFIKDNYLLNENAQFRNKGQQRLTWLKKDRTQIRAFADELKAKESKSPLDVKQKCHLWTTKVINTVNHYKKLLQMVKLTYRFDLLERDLDDQIDGPVPEYAKNAKGRAISSYSMVVTLLKKHSTYAPQNDRIQLNEFNQEVAALDDALNKLESSIKDLKTAMVNRQETKPIASGILIDINQKPKKHFVPRLGSIAEVREEDRQRKPGNFFEQSDGHWHKKNKPVYSAKAAVMGLWPPRTYK